MTAAKNYPNEKVTGDFRDQKTPTLKVFEEFETDQESYGSSSEEMETFSPKSMVSKVRTWQDDASVKDVNVEVFGRRVRNQIERIRAEDSHLGEDIGECLIAKACGSSHDHVDALIFARPASPLSGKVDARINRVQ